MSVLGLLIVVFCLYLAFKLVTVLLKVGFVLLAVAMLYWLAQPYLLT